MTDTTTGTVGTPTFEDMREEFASRRARMKPQGRTSTLAPDGREFSWGPVQAIHSINGIEIVEYLVDNSNLSNPSEHSVRRHGRPGFHVYIDGRGTSNTYNNLDSALVAAIAHRRLGLNSQAAHHFDLMTLGSLPEDA